MREELKQQIRNIIGSLGKAEAILDSCVKKKDEEALASLYEDMQNAAIEIGNTIDLVEGEETETVKLLEEYCELIWQYMVEADCKEKFRIGRLMAGKRGEITQSLETEFKGELEVVFLLCKAAGWENMKHFMAIAEEKANCCLIMAPYVSYSPDGTESRICEASLLPESVKAEVLEDYDMEEEKPDLVFIDGPYAKTDQANETDKTDETQGAGTAPGYDFMAIRKSAGLLIYMPHYEEGQNIEAECLRDCISPQVQCSDIILVASEAVGAAYISALKQMEGGQEHIKKIYTMDAMSGEKLLGKGVLRENRMGRIQ